MSRFSSLLWRRRVSDRKRSSRVLQRREPRRYSALLRCKRTLQAKSALVSMRAASLGSCSTVVCESLRALSGSGVIAAGTRTVVCDLECLQRADVLFAKDFGKYTLLATARQERARGLKATWPRSHLARQLPVLLCFERAVRVVLLVVTLQVQFDGRRSSSGIPRIVDVKLTSI